MTRRTWRWVRIGAFPVLFASSLLGSAASPAPEISASAQVGRLSDGRWLMPTGQILSPTGRQVEMPGVRPQAIALAPNGRLLAIGGTDSKLLVFDPSDPRGVVRRIDMPPDLPETTQQSLGTIFTTDLSGPRDEKFSVAGLIFSSDGTRLYFSNANGSIKVFAVDDHAAVRPLRSLPLPAAHAPKREAEIPAGLALSTDSRRLYVVGNLSNRLLELDAETGRLLRSWEVGVAPFDVVLVGHRAYVTNQGGRRPANGDRVGPAGRGQTVRVDARSIADEGTLSVIDLDRNGAVAELAVGLHPTAIAVAPRGRYVVVANSGSDTLSVIRTSDDALVEKIWARQAPSDLFGAQPCALAFDSSGDRLYVCNGTQNAVAVVAFEPKANASQVIGLIPVDWFPAGVAFDRIHRRLYVANMKGLGSARHFAPGEKIALRTKDYMGTLSLVPLPRPEQLSALTAQALFDMSYPQLKAARLPARPGVAPRPVPERTGEPSVFRHVVYILKENRTYDQILGDMKEGNGDPTLCTFGETYTPNSHEICRQFLLLDNMYCCGVRSADGHQWSDSALTNEYEERGLTSSSPRSYPDGKEANDPDALAYASSGFIWDDILSHGKTFRNYGEWLISTAGWADAKRRAKPTWLDYWRDDQNGTHQTRLSSYPAIEAMRPYTKLDTVGWDLKVPDVMRAAKFAEEIRRFEREGGFPSFCFVYLPNDHTGGVRPGSPTPGAEVADNDRAVGLVVEALSHSKFWRDTCVFAVEDDPQSGWDHVSGYRTTCYVASPYSRLKRTISVRYNQLSLMRTMELILGLPPMNQLDAAASGMNECFSDRPDVSPFVAVAPRIPLDTLNPVAKSLSNVLRRKDAVASARLPLEKPDQCDEDTLNRILWRAMKGGAGYPTWAVKAAPDDDD